MHSVNNFRERTSRERRSVPVDRFRNRAASRAPLATHEEITPSLRSSFCSDYYQRSILDSDNDDDEKTSLSVPYVLNDSPSNGSIRSSLLESSNISLNSSASINNNNKNNFMNDFTNKLSNENNDDISVNITDNDYDLSLCNDISISNDHKNVTMFKNVNENDKADNLSFLPYCTTV